MKGAGGVAKTRELEFRKIVEPPPQPTPASNDSPGGDDDGRDPTPPPNAGRWAEGHCLSSEPGPDPTASP